MDRIDSAIGRLNAYQKTLDYNWWDKFWASVRGATTAMGGLSSALTAYSMADAGAVVGQNTEDALLESKAQAKVIQNAARFLTDSVKEGSIAYSANDNRRTYHQESGVNLSGNNFYIRDERDIRSLAVEITARTRRQQRGKGLRMAQKAS